MYGKQAHRKTTGCRSPTGKTKMRIITVNIPTVILEVIETLCGDKYGFYPSRSELIRVATIERVRHDMELLNKLSKNTKNTIKQHENGLEEKKIRVPIGNADENGVYNEFKEYKIVRRLEY